MSAEPIDETVPLLGSDGMGYAPFVRTTKKAAEEMVEALNAVSRHAKPITGHISVPLPDGGQEEPDEPVRERVHAEFAHHDIHVAESTPLVPRTNRIPAWGHLAILFPAAVAIALLVVAVTHV